ncbi:hypothetical protein WDV93_15235 [Pantoea ananatis]
MPASRADASDRCGNLTGAAKTAVGNDYHALFTFDDGLAQSVMGSAVSENEPFWRLPLAEIPSATICHRTLPILITLPVRRIRQVPAAAAAFLSYFVRPLSAGLVYILTAQRPIAKARSISGLPVQPVWVSVPSPTCY